MFDSHAHVSFDGVDDREGMILRAREAGVLGWLEIGTDVTQSERALQLAEKEQNVWASVGVHPSDVRDLNDEDWMKLETLLVHESAVAVGEVGIDFYHGWEGVSADEQQEIQVQALHRFMRLARDFKLPVIWHVRDGKGGRSAHEVVLALLSDFSDEERPSGVMHTFSGDVKQARDYLELGMYLSFSGVVTFKNAGETLQVAKEMRLDRMLIETDMPFLTPEPFRGKVNELAYVRYVGEKIADARGMELEEIVEVTTRNVEELFGLNLVR